ncbi:ABC-type antimicrobial peptide transport system, ATPase component [Desulfocapsa sulfexigens DSM 10523]|uniref:ABC-type antimicrobial peptide transport system, ATPase component n=1 Tax=Desulfocapsa sulfexigens (strain DSM 10523 / SB164P1) TaxID=1167006 RepID=M1PAN1_DESSD|nr:ABC transporter ATP-binding protein [Desulfocapsa sulfexigens]AGF78712.1 ABC-type antimicrobial peptide transport system, ATPase component [Desulfocapsa sulfexigens DSM 10523]
MTSDQKQIPTDTRKAEAVLKDIWKTYTMGAEKVHALAGVSLVFERGSFWAILGTSGSGKSTLLNLLGCLDRPTSGRYLLRGNDISLMDDDALSEIRLRNIGFIFQSFNLIQQSTVEENIELPLYYQGIDAAESRNRARKLAAMVGLEKRLNHRPMELSGGQQQRVAIARSLANDPGLLLADEPTGNLDSQTSAEIMRLLCKLNDQGKTIIMVTHEPDIAAFAHKRLYMKDGAIERLEG